MVVFGDSMADWLGYGLDELYSEQPETGVERKIRATSALVRYDAEQRDLGMAAGGQRRAGQRKAGRHRRNARASMIARRCATKLRHRRMRSAPASRLRPQSRRRSQPAPQAPPDKTAVPADTEAPPQPAAQAETQRPVPGGSYEFHTDPWATLYAKRIDDMIAALKSKGVPISSGLACPPSAARKRPAI